MLLSISNMPACNTAYRGVNTDTAVLVCLIWVLSTPYSPSWLHNDYGGDGYDYSDLELSLSFYTDFKSRGKCSDVYDPMVIMYLNSVTWWLSEGEILKSGLVNAGSECREGEQLWLVTGDWRQGRWVSDNTRWYFRENVSTCDRGTREKENDYGCLHPMMI